ncbi:MAG: hypothetical protein PVG60_07060 [Desulfarculaceae bacterium]|jgi:hypothetical protein
MDDLSRDKSLQKTLRKQSQSGRGSGSRWPWILALFLVCTALVFVAVFWGQDSPQMTQEQVQEAAKTDAASKGAAADKSGQQVTEKEGPGGKKVVDLGSGPSATTPGAASEGQKPAQAGAAEAQTTQEQEQARRKKPYGLEKSLDAVVLSDESIKVGDKVVPMAEMERKLVVEQRGDVLEKPLDKKGKPEVSAWGVHVVRPKENLWGIHFRLLHEYMGTKGVELAADSDQPSPQGYSSGVGQVLKFAEHMVGVYNLKTRQMSKDLDHLEPGKKVVVYNLNEIFGQLAKIDPNDLTGVMYDGRVLLFPKKKKIPSKPATGSPKNQS